MTCTTVSHTVTKKINSKTRKIKVSEQVYTTKTVTGPVTFTTTAVDQAQLSCGRVVYATGIAARGAKHPELALSVTRTLRAGRYTLALRWQTGRASHTTQPNDSAALNGPQPNTNRSAGDEAL